MIGGKEKANEGLSRPTLCLAWESASFHPPVSPFFSSKKLFSPVLFLGANGSDERRENYVKLIAAGRGMAGGWPKERGDDGIMAGGEVTGARPDATQLTFHNTCPSLWTNSQLITDFRCLFPLASENFMKGHCL